MTAILPEPVRTTVGGIPTLWADVPGDHVGALVVGVGARDLSPTTAGLHHLVEHLVMARVGRVATEHNAESGPDSLVFWAAGDPSAVADFLGRVTAAMRSLADVRDEDLAVERATVVAEVGPENLYAHVGPFASRWGTAGLGLVDLSHAALLALTASDVREFAARWFVTGSTRLVLTGPPGDDLEVVLPDRPAPARAPHPAPLDLPVPGIVYGDEGGLSLSFLVGAGTLVRQVVGEVLEETLLRELRLRTGRVYSVEVGAWTVDGDTTSWVLHTDPSSPRAALDVLASAVRTLRRLAEEGPDADVLAHVRSALRSRWSMTDTRRSWLVQTAEAEARGQRPPTAWTSDVDAVDAEQVRAAVAAMLPTLLVTYPRGLVADPEACERLEQELGLEPHRRFRSYDGLSRREVMVDIATGGEGAPGFVRGMLSARGSQHRGKLRSPQRGEEIWLGPRQLFLPAIGARLLVQDLVLVGEDDDGDVELVTRTGDAVILNPRHFRRASRPWARYLASIPPQVVRHKRGLAEILARVDGEPQVGAGPRVDVPEDAPQR